MFIKFIVLKRGCDRISFSSYKKRNCLMQFLFLRLIVKCLERLLPIYFRKFTSINARPISFSGFRTFCLQWITRTIFVFIDVEFPLKTIRIRFTDGRISEYEFADSDKYTYSFLNYIPSYSF